MIKKTFTAKCRTPEAWFRQKILIGVDDEFDVSKTYTCEILGSNIGTSGQPKFLGFVSESVNGILQNYVELQLSARCNNALITVGFYSETEVIEKVKFEFLKWFAGYFTWLDFVFKWVPIKTIKTTVKWVMGIMLGCIIAGMLYGSVEWLYEYATGDDFDDSYIVQLVERLTAKGMSNWMKTDGIDSAIDLSEFLKEKTVDIAEETTEKLGDLKEDIVDKYEDITD